MTITNPQNQLFQKDELLDKINSLLSCLKSDQRVSEQDKNEIKNILGLVKHNTEALGAMSKEYERIDAEFRKNPPFSWNAKDKNDLEKDIAQYFTLIGPCYKIDCSCILIDKPSLYAAYILFTWGIKKPFIESSFRRANIHNYILKLKIYLQEEDKDLLSEMELKPYLVEPYLRYLISQLEKLEQHKNIQIKDVEELPFLF